MVWLAAMPASPETLAQTPRQDRTRFVDWAYQDAGALVHDVGRRAPLLVFGSAAILAPASSLDPWLQNKVQASRRGTWAWYLDLTNELGGSRVTPAAAGLFALSLATKNETFQDAAFTSLQSILYAGAITRVLKGSFGRSRPAAGFGGYKFDPWSGYTSFPSGHTTAAFAAVTPWVLYYPNAATYSLFVLSSGTAVARIAFNKHWPTDVLAGAAVGFFTARYLARRHQRPHDEAARLSVHPAIGGGGAGVILRFRVD